MKVLLVNGSPHEKGCTYTALAEVAAQLCKNGVDSEILWLGTEPIRSCLGCRGCYSLGKPRCVFGGDVVETALEKMENCDGIIVGSPVHYAAPSGSIICLLDRLFYSTRFEKRDKVGAAVVCARRGGCTAAFDVLNKYFTISGMPIATSTYWNQVHGGNGEEAALDEEGMLCMRNLARNAAFLMKSISLGKEANGLPETEKRVRTNFIRK